MKVLFIFICIFSLNGCTTVSNLTIGASALSSIFDRYEKYNIEQRLTKLENKILKKTNDKDVNIISDNSDAGSY